MSAFLITRKHRQDWDLPVFSIGERDAITMFTSRARAVRYLHNSGLNLDHEVTEVTAFELIEVMLAANEDGVAWMAINAEGQGQAGGQQVLPIDTKLAELAAAVARDAIQEKSGG